MCGRERERLRALSLRICSFGWDGDFGARRRHANSTDHGSGSFLLEGPNTCFRASERWARGSDIEHGWTVAVELFPSGVGALGRAVHAGSPAPEVLPPEPCLPQASSASRAVLRASRSKLGSCIQNAPPTILRIPESRAGSAEFRADLCHTHAPCTENVAMSAASSLLINAP